MTKKHLICFFALTFAISWGIPGVAILLSVWFPGVPFSLEMYTPLYFVSVWGPAVAALVVIGRRAGFPGVGSYMRRMLDWRLGIRWWLFALLGIPAMYLGGALIEYAFLGSPQALSWYKGSWLVFIFTFLLRAAAGPVEEFGWRGFALPIMQRIMSPRMAVAVLALMHGLWHAPAFIVGFASNTHFAAELPFHIAFGRFMINILIITIVEISTYPLK